MARPRKQQLPGWQLEAVLTRRPRRIEGAAATVDSTEFFHREYDLIVEAAGPSALAAHACEALARADLWTVSAAALVDAQLRGSGQ